MKIALIYGPNFLGGKTLNGTNGQFLTGSELSFLRHSQNLSTEHDVHIYTPGEKYGNRMGYDLPERMTGYDVAISWNESSPLTKFGKSTLKVVSYHFNSFEFHQPDVNSYVDLWTSPSESHRLMVTSGGAPSGSVWAVVPNGCDLEVYDGYTKAPGRVLWASSPDRGLHHLLGAWPSIRKKVPWASLHVCYPTVSWMKRALGPSGWNEEEKYRARSVGAAIQSFQARPDREGLRLVDQIPHNIMNSEMGQAECLAYPCDPYSWTESYSVTMMEACAARACPVTAAADAIPSIYGGIVPMVPSPARDHIPEFTDFVVRALTDDAFREGVNVRARALAETQTWKQSTVKLLGAVAGAMKGVSRA